MPLSAFRDKRCSSDSSNVRSGAEPSYVWGMRDKKLVTSQLRMLFRFAHCLVHSCIYSYTPFPCIRLVVLVLQCESGNRDKKGDLEWSTSNPAT